MQFWYGLVHWVGDLDKVEGERPREIMFMKWVNRRQGGGGAARVLF